MNNLLMKSLCAAALFVAWGAIVFTGKTTVPGADTFIAWIQYALLGLGVVHLASPKTSNSPDSLTKPEQESPK
jgi:hypothetical protein